MALQAMWVHGNSVNIELTNLGRGPQEDVGGRSWTSLLGMRYGWGTEYICQENSDYWFHFAIPTPVVDDGVRARLRVVMVLFTAGAGVTLKSVHVWDGPNRVFTKDGLSVGGTNVSLTEGKNRFPLPNSEVFWGMDVSVLFHFDKAGSVTLHGAGIDFES